jgi:hypothetical protein
MKHTREKEKAGAAPQPGGVGGTGLNSKDLTCNEAQVEELFSKGESTEGEDEEAGQPGTPAER